MSLPCTYTFPLLGGYSGPSVDITDNAATVEGLELGQSLLPTPLTWAEMATGLSRFQMDTLVLQRP